MTLVFQKLIQFHEKYENMGLKITFILVSLQVLHLYWLTTFVIFNDPSLTFYMPDWVFAIIDYLEIPALVSALYFYSITTIRGERKSLIYIFLLGIQFLHILWITDTFVYMAFQFGQMMYLAWFAILVDYLELPVVYDLYKRIRHKE